MSDRVSEITARLAAATPGPWGWFGNVRTQHVYLATHRWGRHFVMHFQRWGMRGAQPGFRVSLAGEPTVREGRPSGGVMRTLAELASPGRGAVLTDHNDEIVDVRHPDAALIAHAPDDLAFLLAENARLRADAARLDWLAQHTNIEFPGWVDEDGDPTDLWERACLHALGGLREVVDDAARRAAPQAVTP